MCGLAGMHLVPELAIDATKAKEFVEAAWAANIHRGTDACGFFMAHQDKLIHFKEKGSAKLKDATKIDILMDNVSVIGAHTRASSTGVGFEAADNTNNHPVIANETLAIHNGHISNYFQLGTGATGLAKVDSAVIPHIFSDIPLTRESIVSTIQKLKGSFVFHLLWKKHPDYSLVVGGPVSPLAFFYDESVGFIYSSEPDGLAEMMTLLGVKGKMHEVFGKVWFLLNKGKVVMHGGIAAKIVFQKRKGKKVLTEIEYNPIPQELELIYSKTTGAEIASVRQRQGWNNLCENKTMLPAKGDFFPPSGDYNASPLAAILASDMTYVGVMDDKLVYLLDMPNDYQMICGSYGRVMDIWFPNTEVTWVEVSPANEPEGFDELVKQECRVVTKKELAAIPSGKDSKAGDKLRTSMFPYKVRFQATGTKCNIHSQNWANHGKIVQCEIFAKGVLEALHACMDVEDVMQQQANRVDVITAIVDSACIHDWELEDALEVEYRKYHYVIPSKDACVVCHGTRTIQKIHILNDLYLQHNDMYEIIDDAWEESLEELMLG